jgi:hypothetical protein
MAKQPIDARSLDLGLRHLGVLTRLKFGTYCAICGEWIARGAEAVECTATASVAHRACGEVIKPGGGA